MASYIGKIGLAGGVLIIIGGGLIAYGNYAQTDSEGKIAKADTSQTSENQKTEESNSSDDSKKQTDSGGKSKVVAVVNGEEITREEVKSFLGNMPGALKKMDSERVFPVALEQVINATLIRQNADNSNVEETQAYQKRLSEVKKQIKRSVFMEKKLNEKVTEQRLRQAYDAYVEKQGAKRETRARHILVDDKKTAGEIISKLENGAEFAKLAKEYSTGPSSGRGGDLGYFTKNDMVKSFSEAAFNVEPGKYTKEPVKTKFGWHVIKVEDRRKKEPASFEEIRSKLASQERREALNAMLKKWRDDAKIKTMIDTETNIQKGNVPAVKAIGKGAAGDQTGQ
jgi:peptidyl-prolyl cis-trans isomerase C